MVIHPDNQEAWTDYKAVADLVHRFATALDQKRGDALGQCVDPNVIVTLSEGESAVGSMALVELTRRRQGSCMRHVGTMWIESLTEARAEVGSYVVKHVFAPGLDGRLSLAMEGVRQMDQVIRRGAAWSIAKHLETRLWMSHSVPLAES